jgi:hypothetical protein
MDIFGIHQDVVDDYRRYVKSFLTIADDRLRAEVEDKLLKQGGVCPDALVQLNPGFERGRSVVELVSDGLLHPLCAEIFRDPQGHSIGLYRHQEEAILRACQGLPFVVTSGTGSGKSLTYKIPIVDHVLKHDPADRRVRAILVYPMNALINSQLTAIDKFLERGGHGHGLVVARYTGQESSSDKQQLQKHPPHILLTNLMRESVKALTSACKSVGGLPEELREVARPAEDADTPLTDGERAKVVDEVRRRLEGLHSVKPCKVRKCFKTYLGSDIHWPKLAVPGVSELGGQLGELVRRRGKIAHTGSKELPADRMNVATDRAFVESLAVALDAYSADLVEKRCGTKPW